MHLVLNKNVQTSNKNGSRDFKTLIELNGSNFDVAVAVVDVVAVPKLGKNQFFYNCNFWADRTAWGLLLRRHLYVSRTK
jgi:hypothetical protein